MIATDVILLRCWNCKSLDTLVPTPGKDKYHLTCLGCGATETRAVAVVRMRYFLERETALPDLYKRGTPGKSGSNIRLPGYHGRRIAEELGYDGF